MQTLIKYSEKEFAKVKAWFPDLDYYPDDKSIAGCFVITPCYYRKKEYDNFVDWKIEECSSNYDKCITGEYLIKIDFTLTAGPRVYEISEKIERFAKELNKPTIDLHLYSDNRCCLGIAQTSRKPLSKFVIEDVYPYFVWHAYYYKYREIPPCGEYSHGEAGYQEAIDDCEKRIKYYGNKIAGNVGRNNKCPCGSNIKYKKCCLVEDECLRKELVFYQNQKIACKFWMKDGSSLKQ